MMTTVDGFPIQVCDTGPDQGSVVVLLCAAQRAPGAYDALCDRLHTASLRTIVVGPEPRLTPKSVVGVLDVLDISWGVLVGVIRDDHCPPVEINTTALVSSPAAHSVAQASQRYVYGDYRVVELLGRRNAHESTAQLAAEIVLRTSTW
jgi:hypothetical protein